MNCITLAKKRGPRLSWEHRQLVHIPIRSHGAIRSVRFQQETSSLPQWLAAAPVRREHPGVLDWPVFRRRLQSFRCGITLAGRERKGMMRVTDSLILDRCRPLRGGPIAAIQHCADRSPRSPKSKRGRPQRTKELARSRSCHPAPVFEHGSPSGMQ